MQHSDYTCFYHDIYFYYNYYFFYYFSFTIAYIAIIF